MDPFRFKNVVVRVEAERPVDLFVLKGVGEPGLKIEQGEYGVQEIFELQTPGSEVRHLLHLAEVGHECEVLSASDAGSSFAAGRAPGVPETRGTSRRYDDTEV